MKRPSLGMAPIKTEVSVEAYAEIMRLEKTIERLREALRIIGESCPSHIIRSKDADVNALLAYNAGLNARAALGEKK